MSTVGSNPTLSATFHADAHRNRGVPRPRRGRLEAYGAALEMRFGATRRGFESPPLRHSTDPRLTAAPGTDTIAAVVLGGELAVPCTRNPL